MVDHYEALCVEPNASFEEIEEAFETQLAACRAKRQRSGDVYQAIAVLGDPVLRVAYDLKRSGSAVSCKLACAKDSTVGTVSDAIAEIDVADVVKQAREAGLKGVVLLCGATARAGDVTAALCRRLQVAAANYLNESRG